MAEDGARTALIVACALGNAAGAARLLDAGADANAPGYTVDNGPKTGLQICN